MAIKKLRFIDDKNNTFELHIWRDWPKQVIMLWKNDKLIVDGGRIDHDELLIALQQGNDKYYKEPLKPNGR